MLPAVINLHTFNELSSTLVHVKGTRMFVPVPISIKRTKPD